MRRCSAEWSLSHLDPEPLTVGVSTVLRRTGSFLVRALHEEVAAALAPWHDRSVPPARQNEAISAQHGSVPCRPLS